jgi:Nucleoside 2-deoxyribosyltransferase
MDFPDTLNEGAAWADSYRPVLDRAFAAFMETDEWPLVASVQRDLDRAKIDIDVREAVRKIPTMTGTRTSHYGPERVEIPLHLLRHIPAAEELIQACEVIIKRVTSLYLSPEPKPRLNSNDSVLEPFDRLVVMRAGELLNNNGPDPFGGGTRGESEWEYEVHEERARDFLSVDSLDAYFDRQQELLLSERDQTSPPRPRSIFVLMPFGENWSRGVYDMLHRALRSLDERVKLHRADDIFMPGKITDQIADAIERADALIADITGTNPNVMWELGYAQALRKPVIILNQSVEDSPFDVHDWRQINYSITPTEQDHRAIEMSVRQALELVD